ncbi:uncharacterized protein STEHIDRAFT_164004 [Stereum hirsutum FP-91666 SS1]|uniref:Uncharacterized protein n=1 Tax=Stereum hirsutum (strain FP-91666) TaxID=721885 RepID=R7RXL1_STEHR|nr:uncharacterized protein STEHIDRAFT_164004 [Stereum hirsutum FP-91666 SS1]EIM79112.1 hypothetical protein STEHIDRAFT_164004 [Stereum hirsutum FP-91666 SS1]
MESFQSPLDEIKHLQERLEQFKRRDDEWEGIVDLLDDKIRWLHFNLHKEKGDKMRLESELIAVKRALGPSALTLLQERLNTPVIRLPELPAYPSGPSGITVTHTTPTVVNGSRVVSRIMPPPEMVNPRVPPQSQPVAPAQTRHSLPPNLFVPHTPRAPHTPTPPVQRAETGIRPIAPSQAVTTPSFQVGPPPPPVRALTVSQSGPQRLPPVLIQPAPPQIMPAPPLQVRPIQVVQVQPLQLQTPDNRTMLLPDQKRPVIPIQSHPPGRFRTPPHGPPATTPGLLNITRVSGPTLSAPAFRLRRSPPIAFRTAQAVSRTINDAVTSLSYPSTDGGVITAPTSDIVWIFVLRRYFHSK